MSKESSMCNLSKVKVNWEGGAVAERLGKAHDKHLVVMLTRPNTLPSGK